MKKLFLSLLLNTLVLTIFAQTESTRVLFNYAKCINRFNKLNPQEKVYLHFDNTGYFLGDTIWFKAYTVLAEQLHPTSLSKVLHVELLTAQGDVVDSRKLKIEEGQCHGEFALPYDYRSGFYEVRAYTRGMLNFGDSCLFSRVFPVYDEPDVQGDYADKKMNSTFGLKNKRENIKLGKKVNMAFYPEGGNLVLGLRSRVAFKVWNENGEALSATGSVLDASGEPVAYLSTFHEGMGFFDFLPKETTYKVSVEYNGKSYTFPFANVLPAGYVARVTDTDPDYFQVQLQKSPSLPVDTVAVSVSCRGTVYAVEVVCLKDEPYEYRLSKSALPAGCLQFTLYDSRGRILSERLSFNNHLLPYGRISVDMDKPHYKPLEKVSMTLSLSDPDGNPCAGSFSLAVRDAEHEMHTSYRENILTDLLLSSDIRGYIANPMQYFERDDRITRTKIDLLMMVQGWRRYNWEVMAGTRPFHGTQYVEEALPVSGRVMELLRNKVKSGSDVVFWMTKNGVVFHGRCKTDDNGRFHFLLPDSAHIEGKWELGLSITEKGKQKHCRIMLDRLFSPVARSYSYADLYVKDTIAVFEDDLVDSLENRHFSNVMQYLPQVVVKRRKPEGLKPDIVCDVEKDVNSLMDLGKNYPGTLGEYLENNVRNVHIDDFSGLYRYANLEMYYCFDYKSAAFRNKVRQMPPHLRPIENIRRVDIYYRNTNAWIHIAEGRDDLIEIEKDFQMSDSHITDLGMGSDLERKRHERAQRKAFFTGQPQDENRMLKLTDERAVLVYVHLYDDGLHDGYKKGIRHTFYYGFSPVREFYHVNHNGSIPGDVDFRRTLYWNPEVKTDEQGRAKIDFYNNATCRRMSISAEGMKDQMLLIIR